MREIKFRVWNNNKNEMHEDCDGYIGDSEWIGINELISLANKNGYVFMQYTGFKDKYDREIYEDDIVGFFLDKDNKHNGRPSEWAKIIKWNDETGAWAVWDECLTIDRRNKLPRYSGDWCEDDGYNISRSRAKEMSRKCSIYAYYVRPDIFKPSFFK